MSDPRQQIDDVLEAVEARNPGEPEFLQAVKGVLVSLSPALDARPDLLEARILQRLVEPERQLIFRVPWTDDDGGVHVQRAMRVEYNSALGPYKGGLRFVPELRLDTIKFLGFEQTLKNALTGLSIGGGKGGADFDPKGRSDGEVMRFCQSLMTELHRHIGPDTDVPAGDAGVGEREIGYLFGQYRRITGTYAAGALTGKGVGWGGARGRAEATGYGLVYFVAEMLEEQDEDLDGKRVVVSGAGNVSVHAIEAAQGLGAKVVACSDSSGYVEDPDGFDVDLLREVKLDGDGSLADYAERRDGDAEHHADETPWGVQCDVALPCATQNEVDLDEAKQLTESGVKIVAEGANMPCTEEAIAALRDADVLFGPGKATNAGGVAVSAFEMEQNAAREKWSGGDTDVRLRDTMRTIHDLCRDTAKEYGREGDYVSGANIAGFLRVADAMLAQGVV